MDRFDSGGVVESTSNKLNNTYQRVEDSASMDIPTSKTGQTNSSLAESEKMSGEQQESKPKHKDNKFLAVLSMNLFAICATGMTSTYRIIAEEGFNAADFNLLRNLLAITVAIIWCAIVRVNPIKQFPSTKKNALFWRMVTG